jgi:hypothetical protein
MSSAEAKDRLGQPSAVRYQQGTTIYVYSLESADVEIVEWLLSPSGPGTAGDQAYLTSKVRIRFHSPVESEGLKRVVERVIAEDPAIDRIAVVPSNDVDPVFELELQGNRVVAATMR